MTERKGYVLAEIPNFGRVFDCGNCGAIHVTVGPVSLTLDPEAYMQVVALLNTSAANFELWLDKREEANRQASEGIHADENDSDPA